MITGKIQPLKALTGSLKYPWPVIREGDHVFKDAGITDYGGIIHTLERQTELYCTDSIGFDGTQYIITELTPDNSTRIEIEFLREAASGQLFVFGCRSGRTSDDGFALACSTVDVYPIFGSANNNIRQVVPTGCRNIVSISQNGFLLNGQLIREYDTMDFHSSLNLYIGGLNQNNTLDSRLFRGEIYSIRLYHEDELISELLPAGRVSDNAPGLYDVISGSFYPRQENN